MEYLIKEDCFPIVPAPTKEQILAMLEEGRRISLKIEEKLAPMFYFSTEDMFFVHQ
jgi:hypothetical protein